MASLCMTKLSRINSFGVKPVSGGRPAMESSRSIRIMVVVGAWVQVVVMVRRVLDDVVVSRRKNGVEIAM